MKDSTRRASATTEPHNNPTSFRKQQFSGRSPSILASRSTRTGSKAARQKVILAYSCLLIAGRSAGKGNHLFRTDSPLTRMHQLTQYWISSFHRTASTSYNPYMLRIVKNQHKICCLAGVRRIKRRRGHCPAQDPPHTAMPLLHRGRVCVLPQMAPPRSRCFPPLGLLSGLRWCRDLRCPNRIFFFRPICLSRPRCSLFLA